MPYQRHSVMRSHLKRRKLTANEASSTIGKSEFSYSRDQKSSLERLPRELFAMLIEYAPETVHGLRLVRFLFVKCKFSTQDISELSEYPNMK